MIDNNWTSRRRVEAALNHTEPDRVPFDLGGSVLTSIHERAYRRLRDYLGLPSVEIVTQDHKQQLAMVHDDVKERLRVDVDALNPAKAYNFKAERWRDGDYDKMRDEWGIEWWKPVDGGLYYDMRAHPLANATGVADLEKHPWPDPLDPGRYENLAERADDLMNKRQLAYILGRNAPGLFEISLWMRGLENYYCDLLADRPMAERMLDIVCEIKMAYWAKALELVGENVMVVSEADDLCGQDGMLISPEVYREVIKPRHTKLFAHIKKHAKTDVKIFYHCCGAVTEVVPDLIESGIDILNPVQVSAKGVDTKELKQRFGKDLTFWGGGVDTQHVLPRGTPDEVRDEVKRRIDDLAPGGGFVFTTVHNIQADVPPENIMAMWETLQERGVYA